MSRRIMGRGRRFPPAVSGESVSLASDIGEFNYDVANVTKDGGNLIGTVNDLSGNARHLTQGTAGNKPLWTDDTVDYGGHDAIGAAANKRVFRTGMGTTFSHYEWTLAVVAKCITANTAGNLSNLIGCSSSTTGRGGAALQYFSTTRTRRIAQTRVSDAAAGVTTFGDAAADTWEVWIVRVAGTSNGGNATVTALVNGVNTAVSGTSYSNYVDNNAAFFLGTAGVTGNFAIKFAQLWNRALNDLSMAQLSIDINTAYPTY